MADGEAFGLDPGATALSFLLQLVGPPADPAEILHQSGAAKLDEADLLRAARRFPVKARGVTSTPARLDRIPLPALAGLKGGGWLVLGKAGDGKVLVQDARAGKPRMLSLEEFGALWSGRLILVARRAMLNDPHARFGIPWFVDAVKKYRAPLTEVLAGSFFLQLFGLLTPLFFQVVIDKVLVHRGYSTLEVLAAGLAALSLFEVILGGLRTYIFSHTTNRIDVELGARLFRHLLALPLAYFQARRVGDTVTRVRELDNIRQFLTSSSITLVLDLFFAVLFLMVLFIYSPLLTIIVAVTLPLYVALSLSMTPIFRERLNERFRRSAENQAFLVETVSGVETVKSMALEPVMQRRWEEQVAAYVKAAFRVTGIGNIATQTVTAINKVSVVLILFFGAGLVINNKLTVGELVAFNMIASQLSAPVLRLAQMWQDFQQVRISIDRLGDILNTTPEPGQGGQTTLPPIRGDVRIDHVTFRYRIDGQPVLREVSLTVPAGQVVGIVGSSGSGKSTLAKLIQRLYVPETGRVLVDGVDLALVDPAWLRRQIGVVLQENVLFNRTARENIALGDPGMSMDRVVAAAELAGAHEFILQLPEGYGTTFSFLDAQQALSEAKHDLMVEAERGAQARATQADLESQRAQAMAEYAAQILSDLGKADEKNNELTQDLIKARDKSTDTQLRAPIDGVVEQLAAHTVGGVVTPAEHLLVVVPAGGGLTVEAQLANRDVGFVRPGQDVSIKVETFNFTRYGLIHGKVIDVSRDTAPPTDPASGRGPLAAAASGDGEDDTPKDPGAPSSPTYVARIALDRADMIVDGRRQSLIPGMAVTAEIKTGRRTIINYLLSPIARKTQEALHER
jgi:subfamily B ATP-binding cassette protein HlyB/CyaB